MMRFIPVICGLFCDFRYDIDSKSPDLAKHVSEVDQEFDSMFDPEMTLTVCACAVGRFCANQSL